MRQIDALTADGRNALAGLDGASPPEGLATTRPCPLTEIVPGDIVRHHGGPWTVVIDICHDGLAGITTVTRAAADGCVIVHNTPSAHSIEVRTDTRINPATLHQLARRGGGTQAPPGDDTVTVALDWHQAARYRSVLDLSRITLAAAGYDPGDPAGVLAWLRAEAAGITWAGQLDLRRDLAEVTGRTVDGAQIIPAAGSQASAAAGSSPRPAPGRAAATDEQLTAWMAAAHGKAFDAPAGPADLQQVIWAAAGVLDGHDATHPIRDMVVWPGRDGAARSLITVDRPDEARVCVLPIDEQPLAGTSMRHALAVLLVLAGAAAARLDSPGTAAGGPAQDWQWIPDGGVILAYDPAALAGGALDDAVHDVASRHGSTVNNSGPLAQIAYLLGELGHAGTQEEIRTAGGMPGRGRRA